MGLAYPIDLSSSNFASSSITLFQNAKQYISGERARMGATQNRLEHTVRNLDNSEEQLATSESRIRSTDMAQEAMSLAKLNVLLQANQALMAQANQSLSDVLRILEP